jgi:hypothetical protein
MPEVISIHMPDFSGESTLNLFLRSASDGTLLNAGGDLFTESPASSGRFVTTLDESRVGLGTLAASVCDGAESADNLLWTGWLEESRSLVTDTYGPAGLDSVSLGSINDEILDVMNVDTFAELPSVPTATPTLRQMIQYAFMWFRNKSTQDSDERKLFADNGSTVIATEAVSDNGTIYTKNKGA